MQSEHVARCATSGFFTASVIGTTIAIQQTWGAVTQQDTNCLCAVQIFQDPLGHGHVIGGWFRDIAGQTIGHISYVWSCGHCK
eukprot:scaffold3526_cov848-Pavlova_lutheri.AAC.1